MKIKNKNRDNNTFCFFFAIGIIIMMSPFYFWVTFSRTLQIVSNLLLIIIVALGFFHAIKRINIRREQAFLMLLILGYAVYFICNSQSFELIYWLKMLFVIAQLLVFVLLPESEQLSIFYYFRKIFCIILLLGILTYPMALLNIRFMGIGNPLFSESEGWAEGGFYYKNYIFALYTANDNALLEYVGRFCGVFNEPGIIGTFSALLLIADKYDLKKRYNVILLLGGTLSLSFAFFVLTGLYFILSGKIFSVFLLHRRGLLYLLVFIVSMLCLVYLFYTKSSFRHIINDRIIYRLQGFLLGDDNRTTDAFDLLYNEFIDKGSFFEHMFGNGFGTTVKDAAINMTSSYKTQIYDLGYFGIAYLYLICSYALLRVNAVKPRKQSVLLLVLFLISTYQRIGVLNVAYMSILLCGGSRLWEVEMNHVNNLTLEL